MKRRVSASVEPYLLVIVSMKISKVYLNSLAISIHLVVGSQNPCDWDPLSAYNTV